MKMHAKARLSPKGRELLIERAQDAGWSLSAAAEAAGISDRTARKWIARHRAEGRDGLLDRSSAPLVVANRTEERRVEVIERHAILAPGLANRDERELATEPRMERVSHTNSPLPTKPIRRS